MKKDKKLETENKPTIKNYIILLIICLLVVLVTLYLCKCYQVYDENQKNTPVIKDTLINNIEPEFLDTYIIENQNTVIYMCTARDMKCRNFENEFKKMVNKYGLNESIVYLNLSSVENQKEFVKSFNDKYKKKQNLTTEYPAIVLIEDGKAKNIVQGTKKKKLSLSKVQDFIELNKIGE